MRSVSQAPAGRAVVAAAACLALCSAASATFHLMQIEQVVGGVEGDITAQAIQLRMRNAFPQTEVTGSRLVSYDAAGLNPITLITFPNDVENGGLGRRILIATPNFGQYTNLPLAADFTMTAIPANRLAAGSLIFQAPAPGNDILWRLSWGGPAYTGSGLGSTMNDPDGNFNPPYPGPCPSATVQALRFTGSASAASTTNLAQYALTKGAATFVNNDNNEFVIESSQFIVGDINEDGVVDGVDLGILLVQFGGNGTADLNDDNIVNGVDLGILLNNWTF